MIRVRVQGVPHVTQIRVRRGLLRRAGALLRELHAGGTAALVTDRTVGRLYAARVAASLERAGFRVVRTVLPDGERSKSIDSFRALCGRWSEEGVGRDAIVVALGGGVVSDVAGFAASTFARGLAWAALPTTILAQADASIGGKVGVNLPRGKNLVGAFHHPTVVLADTETLRTLTPRAYRAGLAEVLKIGVIRRPEIVSRLYRLTARGGWGEPRVLEPLIRMAAAEKARLVSKDERDRGRPSECPSERPQVAWLCATPGQLPGGRAVHTKRLLRQQKRRSTSGPIRRDTVTGSWRSTARSPR